VSQLDDLRGLTARDYLHIVWIRLWLVVLVVVVCAATAFFLSNAQTRFYQASARLMYQPPADISSASNSITYINPDTLAIQLQSVTSMIDSPALRDEVRSLLGSGGAGVKYTVTATVVQPLSTSTSATYPNTVEVTAETTSPASAARIANAHASAVIALRKRDEQERYRTAESVVKGQLKLYQTPQSKLTPDYATLSQQLSNLQIAEATATGDFVVIIPATPRTSPSSPKPIRSAALGLGLGLVAGIALAFVISRLDTRVRTHRQVAEILGLTVIGRVPHMTRRALRSGGLAALTEPDGHVSESLRMLRSNLDWASIDHPVGTLLITSCVKGEGKTLITCNLAVTLARAGMKVIVIDADLRDPRVHAVFNMPNAVGLTSVALGKSKLQDALRVFRPSRVSVQSTGDPISGPQNALDSSAAPVEGALRVLTSGGLPPDPGEIVASARMSSTLAEIAGLGADYVLIDSPPLLGVGDAGALSSSVDGLLLVSNLDRVRRPALVDGREVLDALPCRKLGVVVVGERIQHQAYYRYRTSSDESGMSSAAAQKP